MKKLRILFSLLVVIISYFVFISSATESVLTLPSRPVSVRLKEQWQKMKTFVLRKIEEIKTGFYDRVRGVQQYVELDILVPLYVWYRGLSHTQ